MKTQIVSTKELAAAIGISGARVRAMVKAGILDEAITMRPETKTGAYKFDLSAAKDCISKYLSVKQEANIRAGRSATGKLSKNLTDRDRLLKAQVRKEIALAKIREMEFAEKEGKLVDAAGVQMALFAIARETRDAMQNIPDRVASVLAAEPDEFKVRSILALEIRNALQRLCDENLKKEVSLGNSK